MYNLYKTVAKTLWVPKRAYFYFSWAISKNSHNHMVKRENSIMETYRKKNLKNYWAQILKQLVHHWQYTQNNLQSQISIPAWFSLFHLPHFWKVTLQILPLGSPEPVPFPKPILTAEYTPASCYDLTWQKEG